MFVRKAQVPVPLRVAHEPEDVVYRRPDGRGKELSKVADSAASATSLLVAYRDHPVGRTARILLFASWFAAVVYLAWHHAFFCDEVRALTLALSGRGVLDMIATVHGEGHPLLWYLLLREAHALVGTPLVLPVLAMIIAVVSAALLVFRSPFGPLPVALMLFGRMFLYEYSVMARNYGISMLIMFVIACVYERWRNRGYLLGVLLLLLANTNVHSVVLVLAFLAFWLLDLMHDDRVSRAAAVKLVALNGILAGIGILVCFLTVYPTFNDAAFNTFHFRADSLLKVVTLDGINLSGLPVLLHIVLFGSALGLIRYPAAAFSLLAGMMGLNLLFALIYPGEYHHSVLVVSYAITLYWICLQRVDTASASQPEALAPGGFRFSRPLFLSSEKWIALGGQAAFMLLLLSQILVALPPVERIIHGGPPESQVPAFAAFVQSRHDLRDAVVVADPDFLIEPLPYFINNPTYLVRERRFRNFVTFTRRARLKIDLEEVLSDAREIVASRHVPVIILIALPLDGITAPLKYREGLDWELDADPAQVSAFRKATKLLGHFRPAQTDEQFDAYVLPRTAAKKQI